LLRQRKLKRHARRAQLGVDQDRIVEPTREPPQHQHVAPQAVRQFDRIADLRPVIRAG
jgi:hypothetical protein